MEKGEEIDWVVEDKRTLTIRRWPAGRRPEGRSPER